MSAFVVSDKHLNTLITYAANKRLYYMDKSRNVVQFCGNEQRAATTLRNENVRSVNARYWEGEQPEPIHYQPVLLPLAGMKAAAQIVRACDCLNYQSCETDDWRDTEAFDIYQTIRESAIADLVNDATLKWEIK